MLAARRSASPSGLASQRIRAARAVASVLILLDDIDHQGQRFGDLDVAAVGRRAGDRPADDMACSIRWASLSGSAVRQCADLSAASPVRVPAASHSARPL